MGSKNKPKQHQPTLSQMSTRSKRDVQGDITDVESEEDENPLLTLKTSFQRGLKKLERDLSRLHDDLKSLENNFDEAIEFLTKRVDDLESKEKKNSERIKALEEELLKLKKVDSDQAEKLNVQERFSRRNNIRIVGFPSSDNDNCEEIVRTVLEKVGVPNVKIERAHRDGRATGSRPRHILAKLSFYQDKVMALKCQRRALEAEPYFIIDDLTKIDLVEKRKWGPQVAELYNQGTKLRFTAGKWRDSSGKPYSFARQPVS